MLQIDKEFLNPNIARTIRFTEILYQWLKVTSERENISFNRMVLQCCKNAMDQDLSNTETEQKQDPDKD